MQQLRRINDPTAPTTLLAGEFAYHQTAAAGGAAGDLYIGDGSIAQLLVGSSKVWTTADFKLGGGANGHILRTDGSGNVSWTAAPTGGLTTVTVAAPLTGTGVVGDAITLGTVPIASGGTNATNAAGALDNLSGASGTTAGHLSRSAGGAWTVDTATYLSAVSVSSPITGNGAATPLALSVAAAGDVTTGTNNVLPVTSLTLHGVTGTLSALDTSHKTSLVGAINEVLAEVASATAGGLSSVTIASPLVGTGTGAVGSSTNPVGLSTVPINLGGTNATTANAALDSLSGASGAAAGHLSRAAGGVWSVDTATYLTTVNVTSPITGSGTSGSALALTTVPINLGGTNGTTALAALDNLTGGSGTNTGVPHRTATAWVIGPVPVGDGGTGATTSAGALDALSGASGATSGHLSRSAGGIWSVDTATYLASVSVSAPITGNGTAGSALGLTLASTADVTTGTDPTNPVTSLRLREVTGALTALTAGITNTNLVAAINSVHGQVTALASPLRFAGTYNAATHLVEAGGLHPAGALQAPGAGNEGWVMIVGTAGTGAAPAPVVPLTVGDWLVSTGAGGSWVVIDLDLHDVAASNVSVTTIAGAPAGTTNVQVALANIFGATGGTVSVLTDGTSITGTGRTGAALEVGTVDAGTY